MGVAYRARAKVVKVSVGPATGNRIARIIRQGGSIPEGVEPSQLEALCARGLIEKVEEDAPAADDVPVFDGPPAKSANRKVWDGYAIGLGLPESALAGFKKPELMATVTDPVLLAAAIAAADEVEDGEPDVDEDEEDQDDAEGE